MRILQFAVLIASVPVALAVPGSAAAQTASSTSATAPTLQRMGRWEEFRVREERIKRQDARFALDAAAPSQGAPAGFENKQATLADFADCAATQVPDRVAAFLGTVPHSRDETAKLQAFGKLEACTRGRMFVSARTGEMRGALAEVMLKRDAAKLSALAARPAVAAARIAERAAGTRPFVIAYGQCLAGAAPAEAVALVGTAHGSDDEKRAIVAMGEPLKACMPEGVAYQLNIRDVRNHIADALYRMGAGA
jgi:hypothetical protein